MKKRNGPLEIPDLDTGLRAKSARFAFVKLQNNHTYGILNMATKTCTFNHLPLASSRELLNDMT